MADAPETKPEPKKDAFTTSTNLEAKKDDAPAAPAPAEGRAIVKVVTSIFDDKGRLRNPGDIFVTSAKRAAALIAGQECIDAESEMRRKLDEDQLAVEKLKKSE